jgi:uncharacterized sporulation protein YeaH/YhbH (DUF444 family)
VACQEKRDDPEQADRLRRIEAASPPQELPDVETMNESDATANPMRRDRIPWSIEVARSMVAYNERILRTSQSRQRLERAERMLANLRPVIAQLELDEADRLRREADRLRRIEAAAPPRVPVARTDQDEFVTVWNGGEGLSSYQQKSYE